MNITLKNNTVRYNSNVAVVFRYSCLFVFAWRRVVLRFFYPKQLLRVSCILRCYFSKWYSIILQNTSLWCSFVSSSEMMLRRGYLRTLCTDSRNVKKSHIQNIQNSMYKIYLNNLTWPFSREKVSAISAMPKESPKPHHCCKKYRKIGNDWLWKTKNFVCLDQKLNISLKPKNFTCCN